LLALTQIFIAGLKSIKRFSSINNKPGYCEKYFAAAFPYIQTETWVLAVWGSKTAVMQVSQWK